ncbi:MAG: flagellar filament capping protein FliD, partial [Comamonadaceae bacterium]
MANSLVAAEEAPQAAAINKNISKSQAIITGYSAVSYALSNLQAAFDALKNTSSFSNFTVTNSQPSAFTATATSSASAGSHSVLITHLAAAQRSAGTQTYATASDSIAGLTTLTLGGAAFPPDSNGDAKTIAVSTATPTGVVDAINSSGTGLSAQLVNTGSGYKVVVTGASGASGAFSITSVSNGLDISQSLQAASDAALTVDGIAITRSSNSVTDAIPSVTLNLLSTNVIATIAKDGTTTYSGTPANLSLAVDTSAAKTNILALVTAYNDTNALLDEVTNPKSTMATYGGTLVGNSSVRAIRDQIRSMVVDYTVSTTNDKSGGTLTALRDVGIEIDKTGNLTTNTVKLDLALNFNFANTVALFSNNQDNQGTDIVTPSTGLAGQASQSLTDMLSKTGTLSTESVNASDRITKYQDDLTALEDRMTRLLDRYTKQFAAMDSMVG